MTPPSGTLAPPTATSAGPAAARPPALAHGLELLGPVEGSGYERQPSLVRRADGQTLHMTQLLYEVLLAVDGRRTYAEVATRVSERIGKVATQEDIRYLIEAKLRPLGVFRSEDGSEPMAAKANPLLALRWRFVVSNPKVTRRITAPFARLFRSYVALPALVAFALTSGWLLLDKGLASATHQALYEPGLLLLIFGLTMLSAGWHEFGHAAACRYGGATPGAMGAGLYLIWPAFYTDVTDSYRLGRWGRVRVDLGGLYFNAIFAVGMLGVWAATGWDALLLVIPAQLLQMLRQLLPFVRFDGYHILADLTGVPDLFTHIKPTLRGLLPARWRRPHRHALKPWARAVVTLWVITVIPVLIVSLGLMITVMPRIAATAWDSLGQQAAVLEQNWASGAFADVGVRLLSMLTIALPLVAMAYLLGRIVVRTVRRVRRATQDRPWRRALAWVAAAGVIAAILWAWWPEGQYEPIEPHEGGTLIQALPIAHGTPRVSSFAAAQLGAPQALLGAAPTLATPASSFREIIGPARVPTGPDGAPAEARLGLVFTPREPLVVSPGESPPEPLVLLAPDELDSAALSAEALGEVPAAVVAEAADSLAGAAPVPSPAPADQAPGWVFPFNPPREAWPQDNQALALNTTDGGTVYDVAFAMVWVTDGADVPVDQRNDAYALASCTSCTTVAVAFQVILVVGQADVVVPQNVAMAVNYECVACSTYAIAVQLVATLTDMPSDEAMASLDAIWAEVTALDVQSMPLNEIQSYLASAEAAILQVLLSDDGAAAGSGTVAADAAGDDPLAPGATEEPVMASPSPSAVATPSPSAAPVPTDSAEPTTSPTPTPSSEPTAAPTAESTDGPTDEPTEPEPTNPVPTATASP